jgi:hypothetical protein
LSGHALAKVVSRDRGSKEGRRHGVTTTSRRRRRRSEEKAEAVQPVAVNSTAGGQGERIDMAQDDAHQLRHELICR